MGGEDNSGFFKNSGKPMAIVGLVMVLIFRLLDKLIENGLINSSFDPLVTVFTGLSVIIVIAGLTLAFKEKKKEPSSKGVIDPSAGSGAIVVHSEGGNSPAITSGRDTHITYNTAQEALDVLKHKSNVEDYLLKTLEEKKIAIEEKDQLIKDWVAKYQELEESLEARDENDSFAVCARDKLEEGDLDGAEECLKQSFESNMAGAEDQLKAAAADAFEIAELKVLKLEYREALSFYEQATKLEPGNSSYLHGYAYQLDMLGESKKAIECYVRALDILKIAYGDKHPHVATNLNNIGMAWNALGEPQKAIGYFEQALKIDKAAYGDKHPSVATQLNNIGLAWNALGEPKKAIGYYEQALEIWKNAYGDKHPHVATNLNNIGMAWNALGEPEKAMGYLEQALEIDKAAYGDKHPDVARDINNIGLAWQADGEPNKAIRYYEQALEIVKAAYGDKHPHVAVTLNNIGMVWKTLGEPKKAIGYLEQALEIIKASYGEEHPYAKDLKKKLDDLSSGQ